MHKLLLILSIVIPIFSILFPSHQFRQLKSVIPIKRQGDAVDAKTAMPDDTELSGKIAWLPPAATVDVNVANNVGNVGWNDALEAVASVLLPAVQKVKAQIFTSRRLAKPMTVVHDVQGQGYTGVEIGFPTGGVSRTHVGGSGSKGSGSKSGSKGSAKSGGKTDSKKVKVQETGGVKTTSVSASPEASHAPVVPQGAQPKQDEKPKQDLPPPSPPPIQRPVEETPPPPPSPKPLPPIETPSSEIPIQPTPIQPTSDDKPVVPSVVSTTTQPPPVVNTPPVFPSGGPAVSQSHLWVDGNPLESQKVEDVSTTTTKGWAYYNPYASFNLYPWKTTSTSPTPNVANDCTDTRNNPESCGIKKRQVTSSATSMKKQSSLLKTASFLFPNAKWGQRLLILCLIVPFIVGLMDWRGDLKWYGEAPPKSPGSYAGMARALESVGSRLVGLLRG